MGWCHILTVSPPHVFNPVSLTRPALSASLSFPVRLNHGDQLLRKKGRLRKLKASNVLTTDISDSVANEGEVLDGFPVRVDSEEEGVGELELFYDDGYGSSSGREYLDIGKEMVRPDGGPPRWFCPIECGRPIKGAPILLYFPGIGGVGLGLMLHHKSLGKVFEVRCMHIPAYDRTPFEGLVKFVEAMVRLEHALSPTKPIYLVGDSFGGCLALAVAARNPTIDLILILANPATSIDNSQLQTILPLFKSLPSELHSAIPYLIRFVMGDFLKVEMADIGDYNLAKTLDKLSKSVASTFPQLSENGIHLFSLIKRALMYRRSSKYDHVSDYLPPSKTDYDIEFQRENGIFRLAANPVIMSTSKDGSIGSGLAGVPNEGPVLLVGNHMLLGIELPPLIDAFFKEKNVLVRGMAHPIIFSDFTESAFQEASRFDMLRLFGAVPVTAKNMYKLLSSKTFVLLFPGGGREAFHFKGEQYQLFWPEQPEFIRMAARFGATIVPFGVIGEDDVAELVLDYNDQINIPFVRDWVHAMNNNVVKVRANAEGEVANQKVYVPVVLPKLPGRFYYLFGKPYETKGKEYLNNRDHAKEAYLQIKSEIERIMYYLKQKREADPYRSILRRIAYQASWGSSRQVPTFEP